MKENTSSTFANLVTSTKTKASKDKVTKNVDDTEPHVSEPRRATYTSTWKFRDETMIVIWKIQQLGKDNSINPEEK